VVFPVVFAPLVASPVLQHALSAIFISHLSHLLAVLVLYYLTLQLFPSRSKRAEQLAFTTACLHILSPAGLFLSAPNAESPFAFFNFLGLLCYTRAHLSHPRDSSTVNLRSCFWTLAAGLTFGCSTTIRSNGVLNGLLFLWDAATCALRFPQSEKKLVEVAQLSCVIVAGLFIGAGMALPQAVAYLEYCTAGNTRPWCGRLPPSIYSWVQEYYWDVGFMRYWTLNNLPLFLLAAPMLALLTYTAIPPLRAYTINAMEQFKKSSVRSADNSLVEIVARLALPQLVLTVLATTTFHIQIINRISSGYPLWYIALANAMICHDDKPRIEVEDEHANIKRDQNSSISKPAKPQPLIESGLEKLLPSFRASRNQPQWIVRSMIMYAIIQGGLYASFLPPA
jgi:GPI mannosyltransferase 2